MPKERRMTAAPEPREKEKFRLNCSKAMFTYPQNDTSREEVLERLKRYFPEDERELLLVARELHEDGNYHLHCIVILQPGNKMDFKGLKILDSFGGKHGNYAALRRPNRAVQYAVKEDQEYVHDGDIEVNLSF